MDEAFEAFAKQNGNKKLCDQDRVDLVMQHPLFMTSLADVCAEAENSNDSSTTLVSAIQSLVFDGDPLELAENFKHQGNAAFKEGKRKYKDTIIFYTKGIECNCNDNKLNSLLHSNRAAVNLELLNYRSVLYDCGKAIGLDPNNIKAYFRSAKALLALEKVPECIDCCNRGLQLDPSNKTFTIIMEKIAKVDERLKELADLQSIKEKRIKEQAGKLQAVLDSRNYKIKNERDDPEGEDGWQHPEADMYKIQILPDGQLSFPVVFLYPEFNQADVISSFKENDTFFSHIVTMFETAAPWDPNGVYQPESLDWYFETTPPKYGKENAQLVSILENVHAANAPSQTVPYRYVHMTLSDLLKNTGNDISHLFSRKIIKIIILSRNSPDFAHRFKSNFAN